MERWNGGIPVYVMQLVDLISSGNLWRGTTQYGIRPEYVRTNAANRNKMPYHLTITEWFKLLNYSFNVQNIFVLLMEDSVTCIQNVMLYRNRDTEMHHAPIQQAIDIRYANVEYCNVHFIQCRFTFTFPCKLLYIIHIHLGICIRQKWNTLNAICKQIKYKVEVGWMVFIHFHLLSQRFSVYL